MEIRFKKLVPEAQAPYKAFDVDAGFDLFATSINTTPDFIEYKTGIAVEIPEGYVGLIFPRSSVTKYDLMLKNCVGVIDASYRGELMCRFSRVLGTKLKDIRIWQEDIVNNIDSYIEVIWDELKQYEVGDRVAQIVFLELPKITMIEADELSDTQRGTGGFGHTGK
jgi:dUTP pyrophosphatase